MQDIVQHGRPVLVTGGAGFIGGHLARAMAAGGCQIRVFDDFSTGRHGALVPQAGIELVRGDVLDPDAVASASDGVGMVIHLAGVVGMRLAADRAAYAFEVGRAGAVNVLRHSGDVPVVLVSSSAVYGLSDGSMPLSEDVALDRALPFAYDGGKDGYASGKWELEQAGAAAAGSRPVLVVRPFNVVGPGQRSRYGMVIPTFLRQAASGLPLTVHDDGTQRRCFTGVTEFVRVLRRLIAVPQAWRSDGGPYNIGSTNETSIADLAALVLAATGSTAGIEHIPYRQVFPGRTDVTGRVPDLSRLEEMVGATSWLPVADVIDEMLRNPGSWEGPGD
ncbi:NAD-dependent epimerase/dehydratase family protein [Streptomyces sp. RKAG337]|uniref:NAD-dependent epimerase/dehydratase family protein n=1 Tax=Streptomyces sp. RKAG337 TaxID=2893404 RepID=UPI00203377D3|nr:NAD-dependent epimerase/dehydratase family protein [Streptomyces sp. RKAG337]MCM2425078.1 NAD-dependent epimerase/dehydratase family protein [Streptomyces sp. RKAG337]